jgi:two-component system, OmpR family, alkaline phosphatase synthesis response regulator PhoP
MSNREMTGYVASRERSLVSADEKSESGIGCCKVLLVDDESAILSVLEWAVKDLGWSVETALGGQAGLNKLCKESFDILITDLIMPDLDGFFLLKMARKLDPEIKVIIMTGSPELVPQIIGTGSQVDGLLVKPFGLNQLKSAIGQCAAHVYPLDEGE